MSAATLEEILVLAAASSTNLPISSYNSGPGGSVGSSVSLASV
jgi:hypothetical protein